MLKAVREAKKNTNWTCPVPAYEEGLARFIDAVLRPGQPNPFVEELDRLASRLAPAGFRNSLAQVALKLTAPGVPDIYQGCEEWNFSLVDPDNRRPVDFERLGAQLQRLEESDAAELRGNAADGRIKQFVTWRLLQLRRERADLFRDGAYLAVPTSGPAADHTVAYARHHDGEIILVVAARLTYTLCHGDETRWSPRLWDGTAISLDAEPLSRVSRWRHWLTGDEMQGPRGGDTLDLAQVFAGAGDLPFAVLVAVQERDQ
jgi:maltooligosyltrehalose synthase